MIHDAKSIQEKCKSKPKINKNMLQFQPITKSLASLHGNDVTTIPAILTAVVMNTRYGG